MLLCGNARACAKTALYAKMYNLVEKRAAWRLRSLGLFAVDPADVAQDTFLAVFKTYEICVQSGNFSMTHRTTKKRIDNPQALVLAIVKRRCVDRMRHTCSVRAGQDAIAQGHVPDMATPSHRSPDELLDATATLAKLAHNDRQLLLADARGELEGADAALRQRLNRARTRARKQHQQSQR